MMHFFHVLKCQVIALCFYIIFYILQRLNSAIIFDRDFSYNFFGFKVTFIQMLHSTSQLDIEF